MINHIHIWEPLALVGHVEDVSQYASVHPQEENIFLPILVTHTRPSTATLSHRTTITAPATPLTGFPCVFKRFPAPETVRQFPGIGWQTSVEYATKTLYS
jgi:hypothetical protein